MSSSFLSESRLPDRKSAGVSSGSRVIFAGDKDFTELFAAFGFNVAVVKTREDFISVIESLKNINEGERYLVIACVGKEISDSIAEDEMERLAPGADVMFLPALKGRPDVNSIKAIYKKISERASGVDLTRKLD